MDIGLEIHVLEIYTSGVFIYYCNPLMQPILPIMYVYISESQTTLENSPAYIL